MNKPKIGDMLGGTYFIQRKVQQTKKESTPTQFSQVFYERNPQMLAKV